MRLGMRDHRSWPSIGCERMKSARIVVLGVAVAAGGLAAILMSGGSDTPAPAPAPAPTAQLETVEILVAKNDIGVGQALGPQDMVWQKWPAVSANAAFIKRNERADAVDQLVGAVARSPIGAGEPVREARLIKAKGSGYMAAILPSGMRAISTEISAETGAGGFILPNDRVDVILTKREKAQASGTDVVNSEVILSNVRVLAIDQAPKEKEGQNAVVGKTVTLELKPEQTETLARARQGGTLSLALRSIADVNMVENTDDEDQRRSRRGESVNVVRYGVAAPTTM